MTENTLETFQGFSFLAEELELFLESEDLSMRLDQIWLLQTSP